MNPYRFENQNREIVLSRYNMPTPWMNYLSNGTLHAMISQAGGGVAWYKSPQIWRINHYRNNRNDCNHHHDHSGSCKG